MTAEKLEIVDAEEIVAVAEILFQTRGFENTTVLDITTSLQTTESLFFHYFGSTDEILELLWNDSARDYSGCHAMGNTCTAKR